VAGLAFGALALVRHRDENAQRVIAQ
jgi:hypothetical protein